MRLDKIFSTLGILTRKEVKEEVKKGIIKVNNDVGPLGKTAGKTIFGRNDLFWFAYDAFGICYMLDNLTLKAIRKYDDPFKALNDCLIAGKL